MDSAAKMAKHSGVKIPRAVYLAYTYVFAVISILMIAAMLLSFILGGYTFYNTEMGRREESNVITTIPLFLFGVPFPLLSTATLGDIFSALWSLYIIIFAIALNGPKMSALGVIRRIGERGIRLYDNTLFTVVAAFSILLLLSTALEIIQRGVGVPTGTPPASTPLREFTMISMAPMLEEVGFRIMLIGGVAFLILLNRSNRLASLKVMWHPSKHLEECRDIRPAEYLSIMYLTIVVSGLFFGASHIIYGSSWEVGKLSTATIAGIVLGWIYFKQGFPAALLMHWSFNFLSGAYIYFACALTTSTKACGDAVQGSPIVTYYEVLVIAAGLLSAGMILLNRLMREREKTPQTLRTEPAVNLNKPAASDRSVKGVVDQRIRRSNRL